MNLKNLIIIIFILFCTYTEIHVKADVEQGIILSPTSIDVNLRSEQEFNGEFKLRNNESNDLAIEFKEGDINNGIVTQEQELDWFVIENIPTSLNANSELTIKYTIKIPEDIPSDSYTKAILVKFINPPGNSSSFNLSMPFIINAYVQSLFNSETGALINEFYTDSKFILENKIELNLKVMNASKSAYSRPLININIINPAGNIVYSTVLNESLSLLNEPKNYKINAIWPNINILDLGQYTAQVLVTDTVTNKSSTQKITFFNINYFYLILIVVTLVGAILLLNFIKGLIEIVRVNKDLKENESGIGNKKDLQKRSIK